MADATTILWEYLMKLDFFNFFVYLFNYYFPFGSFFWLIGAVIFIITLIKTKSMVYSAIPMTAYFVILSNIPGIVINAYSRMAMQYVGLALTLILGTYLYLAIKGKV